MADSPYIFNITTENFAQVILEGSMQVPVLVDFWASWCQPCQALIPVLEKLAEEYQGKFILAKINTEEQQEIAAQFQIRSIPAVKLFAEGQMIDEFTGALPETEIRAFLDKHITSELDGIIQQAQQLVQQGNLDQATALIQQALDQDASNPRAILAFAQLKASIGEPEVAMKAIESLPAAEQLSPEVAAIKARIVFDSVASSSPSIDELKQSLESDPGNSEARYQLAAQLVTHNDIEVALDELLALMKKDRAYGDDAARKAMIQIFDILGSDHPITATYRSRMFNALY